MEVYKRKKEKTLLLLLYYILKKLSPEARLIIRHSYSTGVYCEIKNFKLKEDNFKKLCKKYEEILCQNKKISSKILEKDKAIKFFENEGRNDVVKLLKYNQREKIRIYGIDDVYDYLFFPPFRDFSKIGFYMLKYYPPGFLLLFEEKFKEQRKFFEAFEEAEHWAEILGIRNVGDLNEKIVEGEISDCIKIEEALHEKKIANLADKIVETGKRVILVAGPSSSGKTTFSKRLRIQLMVNQRKVFIISMDDYFLPSEQCPRKPDGTLDTDAPEAIDIPLFKKQIKEILKGKEVILPKFNFTTRKREWRNKPFYLPKDGILIIEGIHALNPIFCEELERCAFKIYVSALTPLNLDDHNRISTSHARLLRRIVRDYFYRGHRAGDTLRMWSTVREAEEKYIFPHQENADEIFNSALLYEIAVLKRFVIPLLDEIPEDMKEYEEAQLLKDFLSHFLPIETTDVPPTSILREFIGGSSFKY